MTRLRLVGTLLLLLPAVAGCPTFGAGDGHAHIPVAPGDDLQGILDTLTGPAVVELETGDYHLEPVPYTDPSCGNCQDPTEQVPATRGLRVTGRDIHIVGEGPLETVIHTHAGYGILFDGCDDCFLDGLTVTDGIRDPDGRATDAGVVVRAGEVEIQNVHVRDNVGDSAVVHDVIVGIAGIAVREGAELTVTRSRIERNSWDGIAAYRGANMMVMGNVVDGVDKATGASMGGGRGVGIGLTWDARGFIEGNHVTRYWKGIGVFMDAQAEVTANVVEDILTWGLAYWGPAGGQPQAWIHENVVFETGACGIVVDRTAPHREPPAPPDPERPLSGLDRGGPGYLLDNILVRTGQNPDYDSGEPYCQQRPIARHNVPGGFRIEGNLVHAVRQPGDLPVEPVVDAQELKTQGRALLDLLAARPQLRESRFFGAFGQDNGS